MLIECIKMGIYEAVKYVYFTTLIKNTSCGTYKINELWIIIKTN